MNIDTALKFSDSQKLKFKNIIKDKKVILKLIDEVFIMNYIFKNQLNNHEIKEGLVTYLNKLLPPFILIGAIIVFIFTYIHNNSIVYAAVTSIIMAVSAIAFIFFALKQQFSPDKVATYKLYESELEIVNSNGSIHNYKYNKTKSIAAKNVIVLCFSKGSFAIIAKQNITKDQIAFLSRLPI